eukprot:IDg958t1
MYLNKVAEARKDPRTAPPLSAEHIVKHGKRFLLSDAINDRHVMLYEIMLVAMNC